MAASGNFLGIVLHSGRLHLLDKVPCKRRRGKETPHSLRPAVRLLLFSPQRGGQSLLEGALRRQILHGHIIPIELLRDVREQQERSSITGGSTPSVASVVPPATRWSPEALRRSERRPDWAQRVMILPRERETPEEPEGSPWKSSLSTLSFFILPF